MAFFGRFGNVSRQATNRGIKLGQDLYGRRIGVNLANERPRAFGAGGFDGLYGNSYVARVSIGYARGYGNSPYGAASSGGGHGDAGTTFRKQHKGRMKGIAYRDNHICFGRYALQALEPSWITSRQLEAGRRVMSRNVRRGGQIWVRIFPDKPVTARPTGTRMGSGKGSPKYCVADVKPGKILYEMGGVEENIARKAISIAASKMPIRTQFIISE